jgi:hypothetical protein
MIRAAAYVRTSWPGEVTFRLSAHPIESKPLHDDTPPFDGQYQVVSRFLAARIAKLSGSVAIAAWPTTGYEDTELGGLAS